MDTSTEEQLLKYVKMENVKLMALSLVVGLAMIVGCEGPQGSEGPEGPQGPQGPKGDDGTANVIYSDWHNADTWKPAEFFGDSVRHFDMVTSDLTQEIVDQGVVKVYVDFQNVEAIYQLPFSGDVAGFLDGLQLYHKVLPDTVRVEVFDKNNPNSDPGSFSSDNRFRYVLIPGGQASSGSSSKVNPNRGVWEDMSYEELQQRFDIPDHGSGTISLD
ncbi:collagen-like protein [Fodinibius halophilus]|uniref:Collagen-like protein n=1 Tax=Fodinibius halophilus TaxID=1736908 RepID=A0A6M1SZV7_9BACT|nr:collagen-like protein [Fodinibius halophilus]NGP87217.1 collagen-like protein [Fodinibius halophilus]